MNKTIKALKRIREVLSEPDDEETIAKIREALVEPDIEEMTLTQIASRHEPVKQEPVAWVNAERNTITWEKIYPNMEPLYAAPVSAKREWVELTYDEIEICANKFWLYPLRFARAIESAFKEKNR